MMSMVPLTDREVYTLCQVMADCNLPNSGERTKAAHRLRRDGLITWRVSSNDTVIWQATPRGVATMRAAVQPKHYAELIALAEQMAYLPEGQQPKRRNTA